jgi:hypothetical protein
MLSKLPIVTVIPAVAGQAYEPASHSCVTPPPLSGGDYVPPPIDPPPSDGSLVPPAGTPIILEDENPDGSFTVYTGDAPAPDGFVCRYESRSVVDMDDPTHMTTTYYVVCTRNLP